MVDDTQQRRSRGASAWGEFAVTKAVATDLTLTAQTEQRRKTEALRALRLAKQNGPADGVEEDGHSAKAP